MNISGTHFSPCLNLAARHGWEAKDKMRVDVSLRQLSSLHPYSGSDERLEGEAVVNIAALGFSNDSLEVTASSCHYGEQESGAPALWRIIQFTVWEFMHFNALH